jgi:hypothetical protein
VKYASKAPQRSGGMGGSPSNRFGGGAGFEKPGDRNGPPGPTRPTGKDAADIPPRLLGNRRLLPRDNSGGFVLPSNHERHVIARDPAFGGTPSLKTDLARETAARGGNENAQFQAPGRQKQQTVAQTGPGPKVGTDDPPLKRKGLATGES